ADEDQPGAGQPAGAPLPVRRLPRKVQPVTRRTAPRERAEGATTPRPAHAGPFAWRESMPDALIGHTGFVGGNLAAQHPFHTWFNSKNIEAIRGHRFEL